MKLDLRDVPFSCYGSSLALRDITPGGNSWYEDDVTGIHLENKLVGTSGRGSLFRVESKSGRGDVGVVSASPGEAVIRSRAGGRVRLAFDGPDSVRFRGEGSGLVLHAPGGRPHCAMPQPEGRWRLILRRANVHVMLTCMQGRMSVVAPWHTAGCDPIRVEVTPNASGICDLAVDVFHGSWQSRRRSDFDRCVDKQGDAFARWLARHPKPARRCGANAWELAAYVNWSAVVGAGGLFERDAMLMSKNVMSNVWSWDHAFNAMALAHWNPRLAWDQWWIPFDRQDASGCLPDSVCAEWEHFCFVKPPVHGWALSRMRRANPRYFGKARMAQAYDPLARWTEWWLRERTWTKGRLPFYLHGNDSGWDNGTLFDSGTPLVSPDLAALLVLQCDWLAFVAERLTLARDAVRWRQRSAGLLAGLREDLWNGRRFAGIKPADGTLVKSESLLACIPIVLGKRLRRDVRKALIESIRGHLTPYGLATERVDSVCYEPEGYWRGPIWAPATMLIVDGLREAGTGTLANTIASRFCRLCSRSGFAENFNALTGEGLCDRAYTWTSSVFQMLAMLSSEGGRSDEELHVQDK
jgi:hypothetical protein